MCFLSYLVLVLHCLDFVCSVVLIVPCFFCLFSVNFVFCAFVISCLSCVFVVVLHLIVYISFLMRIAFFCTFLPIMIFCSLCLLCVSFYFASFWMVCFLWCMLRVARSCFVCSVMFALVTGAFVILVLAVCALFTVAVTFAST